MSWPRNLPWFVLVSRGWAGLTQGWLSAVFGGLSSVTQQHVVDDGLSSLVATDVSDGERSRAIVARMVARFGASTIEGYRRVDEQSGFPGPETRRSAVGTLSFPRGDRGRGSRRLRAGRVGPREAVCGRLVRHRLWSSGSPPRRLRA
jgi:hypothetical protein